VSRGAAAASLGAEVGEAAQSVLDGGGGAVDAVLAGFLAAAGSTPGVLLSPAVMLVAGLGVGARAFDGRAAQPGLGAQRPRGYPDESELPPAAKVAAPRSLVMLALAHSYRGRTQLRTLARAGVASAESQGAQARAYLIRAFGDGGATVMRNVRLRAALLAAGGPIVGGALSPRDVEDARPAEADALVDQLGTAEALRAPWPCQPVRRAEVVVAADAYGVVAALACAPSEEVPLPDVELAVGADAVPVRRGVQRVAPGTPLPSPAPIALLLRPLVGEGEGASQSGTYRLALGASSLAAIELDALRRLAEAPLLDRAALESVASDVLGVAWDGREPKSIG
jgi:gamma-glutamyltranspeptidase/glutathione hydrolase